MLNRVFRSKEKQTGPLIVFYNAYKLEYLESVKNLDLKVDVALDVYQETVAATYQYFDVQQIAERNEQVTLYLRTQYWNRLHNRFDVKIPKNLAEQPFSQSNVNSLQQQLTKQFRSLSKNAQEVLMLYYYEDKSIPEIVESTGHRDEKTVRNLIDRGIRRLKLQLEM